MKLKKLLSIILSVAIILCVAPMGAFEFKASALTSGYYTYVISDGTAVITSCKNAISGDEIIPSTLGDYPVTKIGDGAFYKCSNLTSIIIPDGVTSLGQLSFSQCSKLTSITIPNSVIKIGNNAFSGCTSLTDVYYVGIESDIENITIGTNNTLLTDATWHYTGNENVITGTTGDCTWTLSGTILTISGNGVMADYESASAVPWGNNITRVIISSGVFYIGKYAFTNQTKLKNITISDTVRYIANNAFDNTGYYNNSSNWKDDVLYIGKYLIKAKTSISGSYTVENGTVSIAKSAFSECKNLTSVTIPDSVKFLGSGAFNYCQNLTTVNLSSELESINTSTFYCCRSLENVVIPSNVTTIEKTAFYYCSSLSLVTLPKNIQSVDSNAFGSCPSLNDVYYLGSVKDASQISINANNTNLINATWYYSNCINGVEHTYDNSCDTICNICGCALIPQPHKVVLYTFANATNYPFSLSNGIYSSTNKANNSSATATLTAKYGGSITIKYYTSTEKNYDKLIIKLNSTTKVTASGSTSWTSITIPVVKGDKIYITYSKDGSSSSGSDVVKFELTGYTLAEELNPTCTEAVICSICNEVVKSALGHDYILDNPVTPLPTIPGCEDDYTEEKHYVCTRCGDEYWERYVIPAPGHDLKIVITNPDCENQGYTTYTCVRCGYSYVDGYVSPNGHTYDNACDSKCNVCNKTRTVPDHVYNNGCDATCNVCGYTRTPQPHKVVLCTFENAANYPFSLSNGVYSSTNKSNNSSATATLTAKSGGSITIKYYTSTEKNYDKLIIKLNSTTKVTASGSSSWTSITIPVVKGDKIYITYSKDGSSSSGSDVVKFELTGYMLAEELNPTCTEAVICSVCNAVVKNALGHAYTSACDTTCNVCGEVRIAPKNHTYDNACDTTCNVCGATRTITHKYQWVIDKAGNCGVNGTKHEECTVCHTKRNTNTVIYATGNHNYDNSCDSECNVCKQTRTVPDHIYSNTTDTTCNICGYIRVIIDSTTLTYAVSNGKATITDVKESIVGNLTIPAKLDGYTVTSIGDYAFESCKGLISVTLSDSVISIGEFAFNDCTALISITIGSGVKTIGDYVFEGCSKLTSINVVSTNSYYSSDNGVLFNKNKTALICYPASRTDDRYVIPDGVTSISDNAFTKCSRLIALTIPSSLTNIGDWAFSYCSRLNTVYYRGSSDDKSNININYANDELLNATWYYNSCIGGTEHNYGDDSICDKCGKEDNLPGDVNNDGAVTLTDVVALAQYVAQWDVVCNESVLDVNGDGVVTLTDVVHLAQYVAQWDGIVLH